MALTHTADEAINRTAALLGRYVPGEALGAVEHDTIDRCLDNVLAETEKIIVIDKDLIPNMFFETLCRLVAIYAASRLLRRAAEHRRGARHRAAPALPGSAVADL